MKSQVKYDKLEPYILKNIVNLWVTEFEVFQKVVSETDFKLEMSSFEETVKEEAFHLCEVRRVNLTNPKPLIFRHPIHMT